jgi:hypothetical protein
LQVKGEVAYRFLGASTRPVAITAIQKVAFVDRSQQLGAGQLHELVFQRRDTQRPLFSILLGDVNAPYELRSIALGFHTLHQVRQIGRQVLTVGRRRQSVHPAGGILVQCVPAMQQKFGVHFPVQIAKAMVFTGSRPFGYCPQ